MKTISNLLILLIWILVGTSFASQEIYWDREAEFDPSITEKDFKFDYSGPRSKTFGDQEIYDVEKSGYKTEISFEPLEVQPAPPEQPVLRTQPVQRRPETDRPSEVAPRRSDVAPRRLDVPKPAEVVPGEVPSAKEQRVPVPAAVQDAEKQKSVPVPAVAEESDKPATKKMQWGKTEEKPSQEKPKFRWGQQ